MTDDQGQREHALLAEIETLKRKIAELEESAGRTQAVGLDAPPGRLDSAAALFRNLVEDMPVLVCRFLPDGVLTYVNQQYCQYFDRRAEDLIGHDFFEFIPAGEREDVRRHFSSLTREQPLITYEHQIVAPDGQLRWQSWTDRGYFDDQGRPVEYQSIGQDITDRKRMEEALRESEEKFRLLFTTAQDAMVLVEAETRQIMDVNEAAVSLYGYSRDEMLAMSALELSANPEQSESNIERTLAIAASEIYRHVNLHVRKDGSTFPVEISSGVFRLRDRKILNVLFRDITAQIQAESSLLESRERFRELAEHINEVFWLFDWKAQKVLYVSPAYETVWGRSVEDLYTNYEEWGNSIYPEDIPYAQESFARITESGGGEAREYRIVRPDGSVRWVSDRGFAIRDENGEVVRIAGLAEDITERKRAEKQREALIRELEAKNAELDRFTYTVSHDLKSPLIPIRSFLGYIQKDAEEGNLERMLEDMARIANAADNMEQLLDELLKLSRLGRTVSLPEAVAMADLTREVLETFADRIDRRGVAVVLDPNLPVVLGDRVQLREVMTNLIDNAIRYLGEQPDPCVEIGVMKVHNEKVFYVRDNGIGIDPRYHDRVFVLFEQLDPSKPGTGIGLSIVKRVIEGHGGRIWVESEGAQRGTTFYFTLPDS